MSQAKFAGFLAVLVLLTGCQSDTELEHPGNLGHPAGARTRTGTREQMLDAGAESQSPAVSAHAAAAAPTMRGQPDVDAGPSLPMQAKLPTVHVAMTNATGRTLWYSFNGCGSSWSSVRPARSIPPESEAETKAITDAFIELGCTCNCNELGPNEVCRREKCPDPVACVAAYGSVPIAAEKTLEADYTPVQTHFDIERKCFARDAYPARTEMLATFCYLLGPDQEDRCTDVPFRMGDPSVTYVVGASAEDAGI